MKKTYVSVYKSMKIFVEADQFFVADEPWPEGVYEVSPMHDLYADYDKYCVDTVNGTEYIRERDWVAYDSDNKKEVYTHSDFVNLFVPAKEI